MRAYKDAGGTLTIGYGHTKNVAPTDTITQQQAENFLKSDLVYFECVVNKYDNIYNFTQNEFDALVSFTYNLGKGNLDKLTDNGRRTKQHIANSILLYNKCNGKVLQGLVNRRTAERDLFIKDIDTDVNETEELTKVANDVILGKYGNGETRRIKLSSAGYDYYKVQCIVNKLLRGK